MTRIYTGAGDRGQTRLFGGERVSKAHVRVEAYGQVDELNAALGTLATRLPPDATGLQEEIESIQTDLFSIGAWLATTPESPAIDSLEKIDPSRVAALESAIDHMEAALPPLGGFILPGGHESAAQAHLARTICRRAERQVVRLCESLDEGPATAQIRRIITYLNRLSDYLFVLARTCNRLTETEERIWKPYRSEA